MTEEIINEFTWSDISIQKNSTGDWFLILVADNNERQNLIYNILRQCYLVLEIHIDPENKVYTFKLVFKYNSEKNIEFKYNTRLTSEGYPSLLLLNNGEVKFITVGIETSKNLYSFYKPLLNLNCLTMPN